MALGVQNTLERKLALMFARCIDSAIDLALTSLPRGRAVQNFPSAPKQLAHAPPAFTALWWSLLCQAIPRASALTVQDKMALFDKRPKMLLQRVAIDAGDLDHFPDADAAMLARIVEDLHRQFRQI